ncbi:hypothetical protein RAH32_16820 [Paracoccus sp. WLY502]|uniref:hypothetical protein n=1 Tax=Paracoccus yibinensis TaxID=3068891 RepID=UPI0027967385|nr:hypothetical protein [Paracoccus sp. WLY502]MDQ1902094.1 hypothetical protein [Paracoccus sp. WLY502]
MDLLSNPAVGFGVASSVANLAFCLIGVLLGTPIGVFGHLDDLAMIGVSRFLAPFPGLGRVNRSCPTGATTGIARILPAAPVRN